MKIKAFVKKSKIQFFFLVLGGLCASANWSNAAVEMSFVQTGSGVTLTCTGNVFTNHFILQGDGAWPTGVLPSWGMAKAGAPDANMENGIWSLNTSIVGTPIVTGATIFGSSSRYAYPSSGTGSGVGILGVGEFFLGSMDILWPVVGFGSTSTWSGETLSSLGLAEGAYTISWGSGANADSWSVSAVVGAPEPSCAIMFFLGGAGLLRRRRI